ncbi:hypothetical protein Hdeb2414_s0026g00682331 [Helianthus debilis subsp. tardiflorus]
MFLFNKIGFIPIKLYVLKTWVLPMCLILYNEVVYSDKQYFLTTVLMKISAAKLDK